MGIARRSLPITITLIVAIGCATQQVADSRLGQQVPDVGLVVGVGQVDGREWIVGTSLDRNLVCTTLFLDGKRVGTSCSSPEGAGTNALTVSIERGVPNLIDGFADERIAWVEAVASDASLVAPVVPLHRLGLPGSAFGQFVSGGRRYHELRFIDGGGNVVERQTLPNITVESGQDS